MLTSRKSIEPVIIPSMCFYQQFIHIPYNIDVDANKLDYDIKMIGIVLYSELQHDNSSYIEHVRSVIHETYSLQWRHKLEARLWEHVETINDVYKQLRVPTSKQEMKEIALNTALRGYIDSRHQVDLILFKEIRQKPKVSVYDISDIFMDTVV